MPGFILEKEIEKLTYNFAPTGGSGEIPEPSAIQIQAFRKGLSEIYAEALPDADPNQVQDLSWAKQIVDFLAKDNSAIQEKLLQLVAAVCTDKPSVDELQKLPYRAQQAFISWITGMFLLPSIPTPATNS